MKGLYAVDISPLDSGKGPEHKARLALRYELDSEALALREATDGMYIVQTSLKKADYSAEQIEEA